MANIYYKNSPKINNSYYGEPRYVRDNISFADIPGREFQMQAGDRLDFIAEQLYANADLWIALAIYNNVEDLFELVPGDVIKLPNDITKVLERL